MIGRDERKVSCGQAVQAMVLNALGFSSRAMYLVPEYMENKPVELLIGEGMKAEDFNDDTLGRSLDALYEKGVTEVFAHAASKALQVYQIEHEFVHLDSSSFHVHGEYEIEDADEQAITITHGYSRDHRPDLKQVVAQMITSQKSALPVWLEVLSGNSSDKGSFAKSVSTYCKYLGNGGKPYFVMDSAGFSANNLKEMKDVLWVTRVPETLSEAQKLVRETAKEGLVELKAGYFGKEVNITYAEIKQRWLLVYSEAGYQRELKGLERSQTREQHQAEKDWRKLCQQEYQCEADARKAAAGLNKKWKYHQAALQVEPITKYAHAGRPSVTDEPEIVGYSLTGDIMVVSSNLEEAKRTLGKFIVATNQTDAEKLSTKAMLEHYTQQGVSVERGFRFLKDPMFFAHSLFLKRPERVMALIMIMGLALLIYSLAERQVRKALVENKETIPDQKGKPTETPTMRRIFQMFEGIDLLLVWQEDQLISRQVLNLRPVHLQILRLLGNSVQNCYLIDS